MEPISTLHFGPFALDGTDDGLWCGLERCKLTAKAEAVLRCLVEHPGRLVRKSELLAAVWPDVHVSDWVLTTCIREIRHVLGDVATAPRYIATVHRQGYRFIAAVTVADAPPPLPAPEVPLQPRRSAAVEPAALQSAPTTVALAEEYRLVTILCGTVADAPALAARLGPERWYRLLQTVVGLAQEVLHHYAGTLTLATSEGFTAVFGVPVAQEDHARRAVVAAFELRQRLHDAPALASLVGEGLALGLSLHSGLVVVGGLGQDPQRLATAVGAPLQVATRLQQQAAPGTILLSAATYALVHAEVRAAPGGTLTLDGPSPPAPLYVLQGLMGRHAGVAGRGARAQSPFVGRTQELALLHARLAQAVGGQGQVIGMVGEPGIGKSRLLAEWRQQLHAHGVTYLEGRCLSYGSATPYLPVLDLLRAHCGITPADGADAITAKVCARLQTVGLAPDTAAPSLRYLLGVAAATAQVAESSPDTLKAKTFEILRQLWLKSSQQHPLILAVEDLHWSDPTSEEFVASLVERLPGAAILFLGTYRPGYRPPWLEKSYATQLTVPPLSAQGSVQVLRAVLQRETVPPSLAEALLARAQGNPFFLEELAQTLVEQEAGQGTPTNQPFLSQSSPPAPPLPPTIQAVLAARIDRLAPEAKRLLQTAAVIGTEVSVPLLQAIAELPEEALHRGLAHLQAAEFLYETHLFPEPEYTFKHALTQEVAYGSLLQAQQRVLHARVVEALEMLAGDRLVEQVERLAHHALRGEVWDKALAYGRQAGDKAQAHSAYREAVVCFEQALAALEHLPDSRALTEQAIDLRLGLRSSLMVLGAAPDQLLDNLRRAETLAQTLGDPLRLAQVYAFLGSNFFQVGEMERAITYGQRALALAAALGHIGLQTNVHFRLGQAYYDTGDYPRAAEHFARNVVTLQGDLLAERVGTGGHIAIGGHIAADSRVHLGRCHAERGAFTEGRAMAEDGLRLAETINHTFFLVAACYGVSVVYQRQGDVQRAIPVLERAMGLCQEWHLPLHVPLLAAALGLAYALEGRVAAGLALVEHGVEQQAPRGRMKTQTFVVACLSEAYVLAGRLEEAHQRAAQAVDLARQYQQRGNQAWALWLLGESSARQASPEVEPAADHYRQALALADELGMRPLQAHCQRGLGTLYAATGQREQACAKLSTAIALYRAMDMTFWLPQAEAALAQAGRGEESEGGLSCGVAPKASIGADEDLRSGAGNCGAVLLRQETQQLSTRD